ncbi:MAG: acyl-CoA synthetase FdrA [Candidatus Rokuibacteriota bacterium]
MPVWNFVVRGVYHDSVTLMRLSNDMQAVEGVTLGAAMMGTPPNVALMRQAGLLAVEGESAGPGDLVIAVMATDERAAERARAAAGAALAPVRGAGEARGQGARPRTLGSAIAMLPGANLALISVPGMYAGAEAWKALRAGLHVMVFSDHVPVETEVALKRYAAERSLLMMGPDCGTALIDGVPLGFANAVPRGRIGLAAASGTGLQEVMSLIAAQGEGVSQAIGLGGRDLSDAVGGLMLTQALAALAEDPATAVIGIIGKPPGAIVAARIAQEAGRLGKPCVVHFMGVPPSPDPSWHSAATLEDAARATVALARGTRPRAAHFTLPAGDIEAMVETGVRALAPAQRYVRGVYAGGTLAWEAVGLLAALLPDVTPGVAGGGAGHRVVDLGEDVFTVGRPHPMIDGGVRREWIEREGRDPATAVLLLDVILGYGAHPDPAGEILPALDAVRRERAVAVVASVCGTDGDIQDRRRQTATLAAHGVCVMPSNAQAARLAARMAARVAGGSRP